MAAPCGTGQEGRPGRSQGSRRSCAGRPMTCNHPPTVRRPRDGDPGGHPELPAAERLSGDY